MNRGFAIVLLAIALAPRPALAQSVGLGGGLGGGMGRNPGRYGMIYNQNAYKNLMSSLKSVPNQNYEVNVETIHGQKVTGTLMLAHVIVMSDLGPYAIDASKVKELRFSAVDASTPIMFMGNGDPDGTMTPGSVLTRSDQEVSGHVLMDNWLLRTELGSVMLSPANLKSITIAREIPRAEEPVVEKPKAEIPKPEAPTPKP